MNSLPPIGDWHHEATYLGVRVGPWRRVGPLGWIPEPYMPTVDDCMRASFCCATGISPMGIPWIEPGRSVAPGEFWTKYKTLTMLCGFEWDDRLEFDGSSYIGDWPFADDEFWIAGTQQQRHAVVMKGQSLHYDCNNDPRRGYPPVGYKRGPRVVSWGVHLKPVTTPP